MTVEDVFLKIDRKNSSKLDEINKLILQTESDAFQLDRHYQGIICILISGLLTKMNKELPKIIKDIAGQKDEMHAFKEVIDAAQSHVAARQGKSKTLQSLEILTGASERIKAAQLAMKESDNWGTVAAEMDALMVAHDFEKAYHRLADADKSIALLITRNTGKDVDERRNLVKTLKLQFLALLKTEVSQKFHD
jgi:hypothetical protein